MAVTIITPASREEWLDIRHPTIGASETPGMLGVSPYPDMTPLALWARKKALFPESKDNKQMRRGRLLEPVAIELLREERPDWIVVPNQIPGGSFYQDPINGLSCTPDAFVEAPDHVNPGICQIKTVNTHVFQNEWMVNGDVQLPVYVAIQAMQEMFLAEATWGYIFAVVGFDLDTYLIEVKQHPGIIARIQREAAEFWRRVREDDPPSPDYARDAATIAALYDEDDGGEISLSWDNSDQYSRVLTLLERREAWKDMEANGAEAAKERRVIDAELLYMLGNAARGVLADGRIIEAKTVRRKGFTVEPTSYRSIKIKTPKRTAA